MSRIYLFCNSRDGNDAASGGSAGEAVKSQSVLMARMRALLTVATVAIEGLFYGEAGATIAYNFDATLYWTQLDNHAAGERVRFGSYGTGRPWWTARDKVTGWTSVGSGRVKATLTGARSQLWMEDGAALHRARLGHDNDFYRLLTWDPETKTALISRSLVPNVASFVHMVMAVDIGWAISYLRVNNIVEDTVAPYGPVARVSFHHVDAALEFAKSDGGMGSLFKYGPFHADGQRIWWENRPEFLQYEHGTWYHDLFTDELFLQLPAHVTNRDQLEAIGVYAPNGVSTLLYVGSLDAGEFLSNVDIEDIGIKHVGWSRSSFIGYGVGQHFVDNAGTISFSAIPSAIQLLRCKSISVRRCYFFDLGAIGLGGMLGTINISVDGNAFARMAGCSVLFNGVGSPTFGEMPVAQQPSNLHFTNNVAFDTGWQWTGTCFVIGPWNKARILNCKVTLCTDDAFVLNTGARCEAGWPRDMLVMDCDINTVMTRTTDGGGIYASGNLNGTRLSQPPAAHPPHPHLRIIRCRFWNIRRSGHDPHGGWSACVYLDLGSEGVVVAGCQARDSDVYVVLNCERFNKIIDNQLINVDHVYKVFYSGFNDVRDAAGETTTVLYQAPYTNPVAGTLAGNAAWKGTWSSGGAYATGDIVIKLTAGQRAPLSYRALRATTNEAPDAPPVNPLDPAWVRDDVLWAELDRFWGTYAWTGRGFRDVVPFATPAQVFKGASQDYETLSHLSNNGPGVAVNMAHVGPDAATRARFPELFAA